MQVLLTAATPFEVAPTIAWLERHFEQQHLGTFSGKHLELQICISGIGIMATSWNLAQFFAVKKPDFCINAGIAGALDTQLQMGDVLHVTEETIADLGVEDADGRFIDLFELGFLGPDEPPFVGGKLMNPSALQSGFLPTAKGITVNMAHGSAESIVRCRKKYPDAQLESMEGAAFFFACMKANIPFIELRAISNFVVPRNREAWDLPKAIQQLNQSVITLLQELEGL